MMQKILCFVGATISLLATAALEGGALSFGQAAVIALLACVLMLWSFMQTDWYEPRPRGDDRNEDGI